MSKTIQYSLLLCSLMVTIGLSVYAWQQTNKTKRDKKTEEAAWAAAMEQIATSHVEGNNPPKAQFDEYLKRDLTTYFGKSLNKKGRVAYEFLRNGATQSGMSYPKYYLWVQVQTGKQLVEEGAVRVQAMDQKRFEVTDYLSKATMQKNSGQIDKVFPLPVGDKIRQKLKEKK